MLTTTTRTVAATLVLAAGIAGAAASGIAGAAAAATTSPAPSAPPAPPGLPALVPKDDAARARIALERQALDVINGAVRHVQGVRPACRPPSPYRPSSATHDVPSPETLAAIAALRRPASPADAIPTRADGTSYRLGPGDTYVDYVRSVTAADGKSFIVSVARSARASYRPSRACLDAEHHEILRRLRGASARLRSATLAEFGKLRHGLEQNAKQPDTPQDGIYLAARGPGGHGIGWGGGGLSAAELREHGLFMSSGSGDASATLVGLVPDGVASITLEYPRRVSRGPDYRPTVYRHAVTRTVRVQQNVVALHVPRASEDAYPPRMVWRGPDGAVVHVAKRP